MARILAISSQVARGHVGLSAIVPALQMLGHEVIALPTILLSNHPGHPHVAGERIAPDLLRRMLDALDANAWLGEVDAVITGYLPSVEHVRFAREAIERIGDTRRSMQLPHSTIVCDPVLGDDPKGLYIASDAAEAIKTELVGRASIVTPNRFELSYLSGIDVRSPADAPAALRAAKLSGCVIAKSIPALDAGHLVNIVAHDALERERTIVSRRARVPHGTGDLMSALAAVWKQQIGHITAAMEAVIEASAGRDELDLRALPREIETIVSWPVEINAGTDQAHSPHGGKP